LAAKKGFSKKAAPGSKAVGARLWLVGPKEGCVAGTRTLPCIAGKREAVGGRDFGEMGHTKVETTAIAPIIVGLGYMRESSNDLHNADVTDPIGGGKHFVESRNKEGAVDFL
jgi:hypothetical protein